MNRTVVVFLGRKSTIFTNTSISPQKMNISKNKTYHEKVYDLTSPMIPHFQLSLKNSQSYDLFKKSSRRCGVLFVHNYMTESFYK